MEESINKIIALVGKANTGKTTTLKKLLLNCAGNEGIKLIDIPKAHRCRSYISPEKAYKLESILKDDADYFAAMQYGELKLGISTSGDTRWNIENKYGYLKECDVFVCASRDKGGSYDAFMEIATGRCCEKVKKFKCTSDDEKTALENLNKCLEII